MANDDPVATCILSAFTYGQQLVQIPAMLYNKRIGPGQCGNANVGSHGVITVVLLKLGNGNSNNCIDFITIHTSHA